jgi:DNA polymerase-4
MKRVGATAPEVEVAGLDEAYLDLTGLVAPRAAMRRLVADIGAATGLGASVGIGPSKLVAKVASDAEKPAGFVVLSREQACARFAAAAPSLLPGIGPKTAAALRAMGMTTIGSLAAAPVDTLAARFGARLGPYLRRRAHFEDDGSLMPVRAAVSESRETTFPADISDPAELERVLRSLSQRLCTALRGQERRARTVAIKVRLDDFSTHTRARTLAAPIDDGDLVGDVACELLRAFCAPRAVRLLGVRVTGLHPAGAEAAPQLALPL